MPSEGFNLPKAIPLDPEQFSLALNLASRASRGDIPTVNPEELGMSFFDEETGIIEEIRLTDNPISRMALTVSSFYREDQDGYFSAMQRLFALVSILRHPKLVPWTHNDGEMTSVHDAVIEAAAVAEIDEHGLFPIGPFLELVRQIEKEKWP